MFFILLFIFVGLDIGLLLFVRNKLIEGRAANEMCKELTVDLARSERERKIIIKGFLDACQELDKLHAEKRSSWGIPDEM